MTLRTTFLTVFAALVLAACNPAETPPAEDAGSSEPLPVPETPAPTQ